MRASTAAQKSPILRLRSAPIRHPPGLMSKMSPLVIVFSSKNFLRVSRHFFTPRSLIHLTVSYECWNMTSICAPSHWSFAGSQHVGFVGHLGVGFDAAACQIGFVLIGGIQKGLDVRTAVANDAEDGGSFCRVRLWERIRGGRRVRRLSRSLEGRRPPCPQWWQCRQPACIIAKARVFGSFKVTQI